MPSYKLEPTVAVEVRNPKAAGRFYTEILGMLETGKSDEGGSFKKDGVTLFVMNSPEGNVWLRLLTDDLDGAKKQLSENGCKISPVPDGCLVVDPYGTKFYLTGGK
jgi:catechol 2,3-dioxygenase-like lactoylglutathione lyase family enzyme